jgi:hypothetical protein
VAVDQALTDGLAFDHADILRTALVPAPIHDLLYDLLERESAYGHPGHVVDCRDHVIRGSYTPPGGGTPIHWTAPIRITPGT